MKWHPDQKHPYIAVSVHSSQGSLSVCVFWYLKKITMGTLPVFSTICCKHWRGVLDCAANVAKVGSCCVWGTHCLFTCPEGASVGRRGTSPVFTPLDRSTTNPTESVTRWSTWVGIGELTTMLWVGITTGEFTTMLCFIPFENNICCPYGNEARFLTVFALGISATVIVGFPCFAVRLGSVFGTLCTPGSCGCMAVGRPAGVVVEAPPSSFFTIFLTVAARASADFALTIPLGPAAYPVMLGAQVPVIAWTLLTPAETETSPSLRNASATIKRSPLRNFRFLSRSYATSAFWVTGLSIFMRGFTEVTHGSVAKATIDPIMGVTWIWFTLTLFVFASSDGSKTLVVTCAYEVIGWTAGVEVILEGIPCDAT